MLRVVLLSIMVGVTHADQCLGANNWQNGDETGACISQDGGATFNWHCPWESDGLASGFGCSAVKYDCTNPTIIAQLLKYYSEKDGTNGVGHAAEWGDERTKYTYNCILSQCPTAGFTAVATTWAAPAPARRLVMV